MNFRRRTNGPPGTGIVPGRPGPDFNVGRSSGSVEHGSQVQLMILGERPKKLPAGQCQFVDKDHRVFHRSLNQPVVDPTQARLIDDLAERDIKNLHANGRVQPAIERFIAGEQEIRRDHCQFISGFIGRARVKNTAAGAAEHEQGHQQTGGVQLHK